MTSRTRWAAGASVQDSETVFALFLSGGRMRVDLPRATDVILMLVRYAEYGSATRMIHSAARGWLRWTGTVWAASNAGELLRTVLPQFANWLTTTAIHDFFLHTYDSLLDEAATRSDVHVLEATGEMQDMPAGLVFFAPAPGEPLTLEALTPMQSGTTATPIKTCVPTADAINYMTFVVKHVAAECFATTSKLNATLTLMTKAAAEDHAFDNLPGLLNTPGGVVDLCTGDLRTHNPDERHARMAAVTPDPLCAVPTWLRLVDRNIREDARDYFQMMCGYLLSGWTYLEHFYVIQGIANTGKSTMVTVLRDVLGSYAETAGTSILDRNKSIRDDIARLCGSRMAHVNELALKTGVCMGHLKTMTTRNSQLAAEFKYGNQFTFTSAFKLVIDTNDLPSMDDPSDGIWRRLVLFKFDKVVLPDEVDVGLDERLRGEYPGILSWCIAGATRLAQRYADRVPIMVPPSCRVARSGGSLAVIDQYAEEQLVVAQNGSCATQSIYDDYCQWCEIEGHTPISAKELVTALVSLLGVTRTRLNAGGARVRGLCGVVLRSARKRTR